MVKKTVNTRNAPKAIGPYSQAVISGDLIFLSGQIALDPETGVLTGDDVSSQTERVIENIRAIIEAAGGSLADVVKTTVYMVDLGEFAEMNRVYEQFFLDVMPARATVQVASLPAGALIEIDAVGSLPQNAEKK